MTYNLERYRKKREKVLGAGGKTVSFGRLSTLFATGVILLIGVGVLPRMNDIWHNRNLDDIIYRFENVKQWPVTALDTIETIPGVIDVIRDEKNNRLILTFNRNRTRPTEITHALQQQDMEVIQLNVINHSQRLAGLKKEATFEAL